MADLIDILRGGRADLHNYRTERRREALASVLGRLKYPSMIGDSYPEVILAMAARLDIPNTIVASDRDREVILGGGMLAFIKSYMEDEFSIGGVLWSDNTRALQRRIEEYRVDVIYVHHECSDELSKSLYFGK